MKNPNSANAAIVRKHRAKKCSNMSEDEKTALRKLENEKRR